MRKRFNELCKEVTENREALKEQRELIDFLLEHDRNDVVLDWKGECYGLYIVIKYIYDNKIKVASTKVPFQYGGYEVIENTTEKTIIKFLFNYTFANVYKFYKITKKDGIIMDITDIVNKTKEDERKKVEAELEEKSKQEEPTTVANPDTPTETDFKYFTAEQVSKM